MLNLFFFSTERVGPYVPPAPPPKTVGQLIYHTILRRNLNILIEVEGITDLLLQVTKAVDTADTTVTHSYFSLVIIWHIELHY